MAAQTRPYFTVFEVQKRSRANHFRSTREEKDSRTPGVCESLRRLGLYRGLNLSQVAGWRYCKTLPANDIKTPSAAAAAAGQKQPAAVPRAQ